MVFELVLRKQVQGLKLCGRISLNPQESRKMLLKSIIIISQTVKIGMKILLLFPMSVFQL